jgi:formylglycine-generating enzyme required for sulfatase activity
MFEQVKSWASLTPFPSEMESQWERASSSIEAAPEAHLQRSEGLFSLGPDPQSKLWEFVDLRFGLAPPRDEQGRLVMSPETGFVFVFLPGGQFTMGSPEGEHGRKESEVADEQQHPVTITPFLISKYEVTQAQWEKVMGQNPSEILGSTRAVHTVSWFDCDRFCQITGLQLPTEAQWEYACRGGTTGPYSVPGSADTIGWYIDNSSNAAHPVGEKLPNPFGLYDMHGNVLEWCQDVFAAEFYSTPESMGRNPVNRGNVNEPSEPRVLRGGSYEGIADYMRSADRYFEKPELRWRGFGLRPIRPAEVNELKRP